MKEPFLDIDITKLYPEFAIQIHLEVRQGEFFSLVGPSGCGKTTLLRLIAGLEKVDGGAVRLDGRDITNLPAADRHVGLVFQEYALFPHLTVAQNIEYGLQVQKMPSFERKNRLGDLLSLFELEALAKRPINQLSGGERQRVAVARALAPNPSVLLMDEPFSALDYSLRQRLQKDLLQIQRTLGFTTIFVTHQQEEALLLSDRLAVMQKGAMIQVGSPQEIYESPVNCFVAEFLGDANLLPCTLKNNPYQSLLSLGTDHILDLPPLQNHQDGNYLLMIRPEDLERGKEGQPFTISAKVSGLEYLGAFYRVEALYGQTKLKLLIRNNEQPPQTGTQIILALNQQKMRLLATPDP